MLDEAEAVRLLNLQKRFEDGEVIDVSPSSSDKFRLLSDERGERFLFDVDRGDFKISLPVKAKYQTRARKAIVLARIEIHGAPHTNPDGSKVPPNHIHIYKEGFSTRWAYPLSEKGFSTPPNVVDTLREFCDFCNITNIPVVQTGVA